MTIIIETSSDVEEAIRSEAAREGLTVQEFALRAILQKAVPMRTPALSRKEARSLIESGHYADWGLSSEALMAERAVEARRENEAH